MEAVLTVQPRTEFEELDSMDDLATAEIADLLGVAQERSERRTIKPGTNSPAVSEKRARERRRSK